MFILILRMKKKLFTNKVNVIGQFKYCFSGIFFRTVNSSRSAFGSFFFKSDFFSLYDFKIPEVHLEENFKCKVAMKVR